MIHLDLSLPPYAGNVIASWEAATWDDVARLRTEAGIDCPDLDYLLDRRDDLAGEYVGVEAHVLDPFGNYSDAILVIEGKEDIPELVEN